MTKDLELKHVCPHFVVGEWLSVENDRQTLRPVKFPSSSKIEIRRNGVVIPKEGLHSTISIAGTSPEPFEIERDENDEFRFTLNEGPLQSATLPAGAEVSADLVVQSINEQTSGIRASVSNGRVRIETEDNGENTTFHLQKGSGHEEIGFPSQRFYHGRQVMPPWSVVRQEGSTDLEDRRIVFDEPIPTTDDIFEVSYFTRQKDCRRCSGLGVEHDIRHDSRGEPVFVSGVNLLVQEVQKIVFTERGSNVFYTWYGTSIRDLIGSKIVKGGRLVESQLANKIGKTLEKYRNVKIQQSKYQPVGDQEFLQKVQNIFVQQDDTDPSVFRIQIDLQNRADEVDQIQKTLAINQAKGTE